MQRRVFWLVVSVMGVVLASMGVGGGLLMLVLTLVGGEPLPVTETIPVAGIVGVGLGFGLALTLHGWASWQGRSSRPFNPSRIGWLWLALVVLVGLGAVISSWSLAPAILLPPIHVAVMSLMPLIMLSLAGRALRGRGGSWREVVGVMAGGGSLGLSISLMGEAVVGLGLVVALTVVALMMPGGEEYITTLTQNLQNPAWLMDFTNLAQLLLTPGIALSLWGLFSIPVPLIEEFAKTLAVGIAGRWLRPQPARAFLWGVAGGAGFALVENVFNGALGGAEGWAMGAISRLGATVMHCVTGGLVGWGWGELWARRPLRLLGSYTLAVLLHGMWNTFSVGAVLLSASAWVQQGDDTVVALSGLGMLVLLGLLGTLTVSLVFALHIFGRRLALEDDLEENKNNENDGAEALTSTPPCEDVSTESVWGS